MKLQGSQMLQATSGTGKKKVATEILFIQKTALCALIAGIVVTVFCLFLFRPGKFDSGKFQKVKGQSTTYNYNPYTREYERSVNAAIYSPLWMSEGFYDYCDRKVSFNPYMPQLSYKERKSYLYRKAFKIGLIVWLAGVGAVLLYRYGIRGQKWIIENAR